MFVVGPDQRINHWSASAREILGYEAGEVVGRRCYEVLGARGRAGDRYCRRDCPVIVGSRRGRRTSNYDICLATREGKDIWVNMSILVHSLPGRSGPLVAHLFRDVTRRRQLERAAARALEALDGLASENSEAEPGAVEEVAPAPAPVLTKREREVLRLLAGGLGTREIADRLVVSPLTARNHIANLNGKLGARSRLQAVALATRMGLL